MKNKLGIDAEVKATIKDRVMESKIIGIRNNRATLQSEKGNEALKITND
ncbi:hypothetical protein FNE52_02560 [Helicobacter pylori]|nr:hypothetical protein FNE52_02560 [Helicobacter pylori]